MEYKYGEFTDEQFTNALLKIRKKIFFHASYPYGKRKQPVISEPLKQIKTC